jgi:hypothetical protein
VTRLWAGRFGVWIPAGAINFFFLSTKMSRPALGPTQRFVELGFPGVKAAGAWSYRSRPFRVKVKNEWRYSFIRPMCVLGVDRSSFTCYLVAALSRTVVSVSTCKVSTCLGRRIHFSLDTAKSHCPSSESWVLWPGYGLDNRGSGDGFSQGQEAFRFSEASRPTLVPIQIHFKW